MKPRLPHLISMLLLAFQLSSKAQVVDSTTILFDIDTVAKNLGYPWEITYGPDDSLWITEARGYRVLRISSNRTTAKKNDPPQQILKIPLNSSLVNFGREVESLPRSPTPGTVNRWPQGGMQGLAIHPDFGLDSNKQWVYLSYVYKKGVCDGTNNGNNPCYYYAKIVRCQFFYKNQTTNPYSGRDTLIITDTLISNLPASNDHNSGRLTIGPVIEGVSPNDQYMLYYTIGDMGAGQFNNSTRVNRAQNTDTCEGKVLRFNTRPDTDGIPGSPIHDYDKWRQWIPNDNPYSHSTIGSGMKTPVYSFGHRNAQGLAWGEVNNTWRLYSSEHGDKSDDEVNNILQQTNYGWPKVAGMGTDNNYSSLDAFANNDRLASQLVNYDENTWATTNSMMRPLFATFNWNASAIPADGTNIFTWGTIAPSSIDFYDGNIPGWNKSLLVTSLKYGMYRLKLNGVGNYVDSSSSLNTVDTFPLLHSWRVRDVAIHPTPNSGRFWVVIDSTGSTSGPTGGFGGSSIPTKDGGKVLMLTYKTMITLPLNENPLAGPPVVKDLVRIFPNPVHDRLYIQGKKQLRKPLLVQVYDAFGKMLISETSYQNDFSVDVNTLRPGVYVLKLYNGYDMEVQIEKFIKL